MSKVVLDVSMSLDGFIAGPNGREAEPRRIPPRKSGPPRRSRGTPIRIQRRASRSRNCPRRLRTRTSRAASSLDTSDLTRVRQERSGSGDRCTRLDSSHCNAYRCTSAGMSLSVTAFCVRTVSHTPRNPGQTPSIYGDTSDAHRCCGKSLIGSALVGFGVRQHARAESISKRARSTTPTSLRLESSTCGRPGTV